MAERLGKGEIHILLDHPERGWSARPVARQRCRRAKNWTLRTARVPLAGVVSNRQSMVSNNEKEPASMASKLRITKDYEADTAADEVLIGKLQAVIDDPKTPPYVLVRAVGSTSATMAHIPGAPRGASSILSRTAPIIRSAMPESLRKLARDDSTFSLSPHRLPGRPSMPRGRHYFRTEPRAAWTGAAR
jgi:hypothetical protein